MQRKIVKIDQEKCNGCGACAKACHEGAIGMVDGTARLLRDDYCDGLGDCLPVCPTGAITFEVREAAAYDHAAVEASRKKAQPAPQPQGCPGSRMRTLNAVPPAADAGRAPAPTQLRQWPVQIKLAPVKAPYFQGARLLVAADCTESAKSSSTCSKSDGVSYSSIGNDNTSVGASTLRYSLLTWWISSLSVRTTFTSAS